MISLIENHNVLCVIQNNYLINLDKTDLKNYISLKFYNNWKDWLTNMIFSLRNMSEKDAVRIISLSFGEMWNKH